MIHVKFKYVFILNQSIEKILLRIFFGGDLQDQTLIATYVRQNMSDRYFCPWWWRNKNKV